MAIVDLSPVTGRQLVLCMVYVPYLGYTHISRELYHDLSSLLNWLYPRPLSLFDTILCYGKRRG